MDVIGFTLQEALQAEGRSVTPWTLIEQETIFFSAVPEAGLGIFSGKFNHSQGVQP